MTRTICLILSLSCAAHAEVPKNVWWLFNTDKGRAFVQSDEGLAYLAKHFGTVVLWADWYEPQDAQTRAEIPHGPDVYRILPEAREEFLHVNMRLLSRGIKPVVYLHTMFARRAAYSAGDIVEWATRMRDDWGVRGLYLDGPAFGDEIETLAFWQRLRDVFPDGALIAHDSLTARTTAWHGRWIRYADYVLIGEGDYTAWTAEEIEYHLTPTADGPRIGFLLKFAPGITRERQRDLYAEFRRHKIPVRASMGWYKQLFDETQANRKGT